MTDTFYEKNIVDNMITELLNKNESLLKECNETNEKLIAKRDNAINMHNSVINGFKDLDKRMLDNEKYISFLENKFKK